MKRLGNIWADVIDEENAIQAVIDGTKHKRKQRAVQKLLNDNNRIDRDKAVAYTAPIIKELNDKTWRHGTPKHRKQFCRNKSNKGKWRDLYIPSLRDHIVAHMVMQSSITAFTRGMHPHCCGSIPGRGIKHVLRSVKHWTQQDKECRYFRKAGYSAVL